MNENKDSEEKMEGSRWEPPAEPFVEDCEMFWRGLVSVKVLTAEERGRLYRPLQVYLAGIPGGRMEFPELDWEERVMLSDWAQVDFFAGSERDVATLLETVRETETNIRNLRLNGDASMNLVRLECRQGVGYEWSILTVFPTLDFEDVKILVNEIGCRIGTVRYTDDGRDALGRPRNLRYLYLCEDGSWEEDNVPSRLDAVKRERFARYAYNRIAFESPSDLIPPKRINS